MICFTFLKGVLPIFCWTGHGSEVKRTNCNQVLITKLQNENKKIKKGIRGKSLHWIEHRIFRGKRCIVETALQLAERLVFANFETSASQSFSKKKLLCHYCKSKSSITALNQNPQAIINHFRFPEIALFFIGLKIKLAAMVKIFHSIEKQYNISRLLYCVLGMIWE